MKNSVLRLKLHQNKAHYRKEETVNNKMTYPLPTYSMIIGAIHNACNYKEYRPMDISIQGSYESIKREIYTDYCFLNSVMDDRGILVKLNNPDLLENVYKVIAKALKSQGNSFKKRITIEICDEKELDEYIRISDLRIKFQEENSSINQKISTKKNEIKKIKQEQKTKDKKSDEYKNMSDKINEINDEIKKIKDEFDERRKVEYLKPISYYASLTKSIKSYEVLYGVDLVIHIRSDEETLNNIKKNYHNITSVGRSEDFVDNIEISFVNISDEEDNFKHIKSKYKAYVDKEAVENKAIIKSNLSAHKVNSVPTRGTTYYINKNYVIENNKRVFEKKRVVYLSGYEFGLNINQYNYQNKDKGIYIDIDNKDIVSFL
ncbi:CRISPR-associated protein Cas5 [Peptostreptococcaceae bacterium oral taxon 081]|nr:CRISPR-associated protein Cas5 [Peptoanaerobacter stomatis]NWO25107.1 CRISPR-associated protein Cas5 [Peptostreptococcaceae bacterium oral taxon 081]